MTWRLILPSLCDGTRRMSWQTVCLSTPYLVSSTFRIFAQIADAKRFSLVSFVLSLLIRPQMKSSMSSSGSSASLSLSSSPESASEVSAAGFREDDLRRALRHHARALKALRGSAYETLSEATRSELITKLENDWSDLKQRLRRLKTPESEPLARSSDSRMQPLTPPRLLMRMAGSSASPRGFLSCRS